MKILKKLFLIAIIIFCFSTSVFANPKNNSLQPIKDTIIMTYSSWDECGPALVENNIIYPLIFTERIEGKGIIAKYQIPRTINKKFRSWDEAKAAGEFLVENNVTYKLKEAKQLSWRSDIVATYQLIN